jgi:hypothetical protein
VLPVLTQDLRQQLKHLANQERHQCHLECMRYFDEVFPGGGPVRCSYKTNADIHRLAAIMAPSIGRLLQAHTAVYSELGAEKSNSKEIWRVVMNTARHQFGYVLGRFSTDGLFEEPEFLESLAGQITRERVEHPTNENELIDSTEGADQVPTIVEWRLSLLAEYQKETGVSEYGIYSAAGNEHSCYKPQFIKWKAGLLPPTSQTAISLERFLRAKLRPSSAAGKLKHK